MFAEHQALAGDHWPRTTVGFRPASFLSPDFPRHGEDSRGRVKASYDDGKKVGSLLSIEELGMVFIFFYLLSCDSYNG